METSRQTTPESLDTRNNWKQHWTLEHKFLSNDNNDNIVIVTEIKFGFALQIQLRWTLTVLKLNMDTSIERALQMYHFDFFVGYKS